MKNYSEDTILKNKVEAVNELHKHINKIVPMYQEQLAKGFKINQGNVFHKRDKEALDKIEESLDTPKRIRSWFKITDYSICISFDTNFSDSAVYLYDTEHDEQRKPHWKALEFTPFKTDFTVEDIQNKMNTINGYKEIIKQYQDKINIERNDYRMFIEGVTR